MKKYILMFISITLIASCLYIRSISAGGTTDCKGGVVSTTAGNFENDMHCSCDPYVPLVFDDGSTPDEITAGGNITVYIIDGCPPFTWTVSGKGYTWQSLSGPKEFSSNNGSENLYCVSGGDGD